MTTVTARKALTLALDVLCIVVVLRLLLPSDTKLSAAAWRATMLTCRTLAESFGWAAISAEAHYWKAVKS